MTLEEKIRLSMFILMLPLLWFVFFGENINTNSKLCEEKFKKEINGIVEKAYIDVNQKYLFTILLRGQNETEEISTLYIKDPENYISTGDSLYKPENSFIYYVIKPSPQESVIIESNWVCGESRWNTYNTRIIKMYGGR